MFLDACDTIMKRIALHAAAWCGAKKKAPCGAFWLTVETGQMCVMNFVTR